MIVMILKIIFWMIFCPLLIGMLYTYFAKKEKNNIVLAFVLGYIIEFALFELITVPSTFLKIKFTTLLLIWNTLVLLLTILSVVLNIKRIKELLKYNIEQLKSLPFVSIMVFALIALQMFVVFRYMHTDEDDAVYVGTATTTIYTNQINMHNPARGNEWGKWQARYVLSPFSIYIATLSEEVGLPPAVVAHTICPVIFIGLMYMIYALIAKKLFNSDKKAICIFLILINILYIFGNFSIRTNFTFALFRLWQGKAIIANICIPLVIYWYWVSAEEKMKFLPMLMMFIIILASCLPSSMGVVLIPLTVFTLAIVSSIKNKKVDYLWKYAITCIPCILCGIIYCLLKF